MSSPSSSSSSVEATLTKALGITFIDARRMTRQARVNLGIIGFPSPQQEKALLEETIRLFVLRSETDQADMKRQKRLLDSAIERYRQQEKTGGARQEGAAVTAEEGTRRDVAASSNSANGGSSITTNDKKKGKKKHIVQV
eukprot:CAMPEP_0119557082 /NCGR_PEP_ID=MMETSP1352-20130426/8859_1 /TAXON_ID=265584 /ORGANISM="Stauroneis constricta, Strain CCMP1120" /LENGTH=139 /DNA_ID=CAMNT_0007604125 /DNA_START=18 /DNA_END=433 /DNA_ORIENTATION=-